MVGYKGLITDTECKNALQTRIVGQHDKLSGKAI